MKLVYFYPSKSVRIETDYYYRLGVWEDQLVYDLTEVDPETFGSISQWLQQDDPSAAAHEARSKARALDVDLVAFAKPLDFQEVWAAGVTYYRSREARMEESREDGGGSFYDGV